MRVIFGQNGQNDAEKDQPDPAKLRELIARGVDLNDEHAGLTPLLAATRDSWHGRPEAVMTLLANGADSRAVDSDGNTPLHHAARSTDAAVAALGEGADLALKWPNDVLLSGGKLSGILLEMARGHIIVGIGVNLARAPELPDRKTAALAQFAAAPPLEDFAASLAAAFDRRLESWRTYGLGGMLQAFLAHAIHAQGSPVTVHDTDGSVLSGTFAGLEESDGALRLRLADGSERVIRAGDIS